MSDEKKPVPSEITRRMISMVARKEPRKRRVRPAPISAPINRDPQILTR